MWVVAVVGDSHVKAFPTYYKLIKKKKKKTPKTCPTSQNQTHNNTYHDLDLHIHCSGYIFLYPVDNSVIREPSRVSVSTFQSPLAHAYFSFFWNVNIVEMKLDPLRLDHNSSRPPLHYLIDPGFMPFFLSSFNSVTNMASFLLPLGVAEFTVYASFL